MNEKALTELLKGIGLPDTIIADLEKTDFDAKAVISKFNESQKAHYHDIIRNEIQPEIEEELKKEINGKWLGGLNNDIKKIWGVPLDKFKDLPVNEKLKIAKAYLDEQNKGATESEVVKKLQEEKMEWQNKYTDLEGKLNDEIGKIRTEESKKTVSKLVDIDLQKRFNSIPADKLLGGKHSDGINRALKSALSDKYDFTLDEKGETSVPLEKGTSKRATAKDATGKEYFVPVDELILSSLKELNFLKESNGGEGSGQGGKGGGSGSGQGQKSQRLLEMEAKASQAA